MNYAKIQNNQIAEYPLSEAEVRMQNPDVTFSQPFYPPTGFVKVCKIERPSVDHTHNVVEGQPIYKNSEWVQTWIIDDASQDEINHRKMIEWRIIRSKRTGLLQSCDWTQLPDAPVDSVVWAKYRQALRDITTKTDPFNIVWPEPPQS